MASLQRYHVGPRLCEMVVRGNTVYLAGQVADDTDKDIEGQTKEVLAHIDRLLHEVGSDKTKICLVQIYLADIEADFDVMNRVWGEWVPQGNTPARATVEAKLADPKYKVEMVVIAAL